MSGDRPRWRLDALAGRPRVLGGDADPVGPTGSVAGSGSAGDAGGVGGVGSPGSDREASATRRLLVADDRSVAAVDPATGDLAWRTALSTPGASAVGDDRIYVGVDTRLVGLSVADGSVAFETDLHAGVYAVDLVDGWPHARTAAPVVDDWNLVALDRDGDRRWSFVERYPMNVYPVTPVGRTDGTVVLSNGETIAGFDDDGSVRWERPCAGALPTLVDGRAYALASDREAVLAVEAPTGDVLDRIDRGATLGSLPCLAGGRPVAEHAGGGAWSALSPSAGRFVWRYDAPGTGRLEVAGPDGDCLYLVPGPGETLPPVAAVDAATGIDRWTLPVETYRPAIRSVPDAPATAVLDGTTLWGIVDDTDPDGDGRPDPGSDPDGGVRRWSVAVDEPGGPETADSRDRRRGSRDAGDSRSDWGEDDPDVDADARLCVAGDRVYAAGRRSVVAVEATSGRVDWRATVERDPGLAVGDHLYVATDGRLRALRRSSA